MRRKIIHVTCVMVAHICVMELFSAFSYILFFLIILALPFFCVFLLWYQNLVMRLSRFDESNLVPARSAFDGSFLINFRLSTVFLRIVVIVVLCPICFTVVQLILSNILQRFVLVSRVDFRIARIVSRLCYQNVLFCYSPPTFFLFFSILHLLLSKVNK